MQYFIVKVDQSIGGYDPVETVHLIATDNHIIRDCIDLLSGLWIDKNKGIFSTWVSFFDGKVTCELSDIKEIDETTFDLLKELGL